MEQARFSVKTFQLQTLLHYEIGVVTKTENYVLQMPAANQAKYFVSLVRSGL